MLAFSLPFSTQSTHVLSVGVGLLLAAGVPVAVQRRVKTEPVDDAARPVRTRLAQPQALVAQEQTTEQLA